jgi:hypothetical protein
MSPEIVAEAPIRRDVNFWTASVDKKYGGHNPPDSSIITTFHR